MDQTDTRTRKETTTIVIILSPLTTSNKQHLSHAAITSHSPAVYSVYSVNTKMAS